MVRQTQQSDVRVAHQIPLFLRSREPQITRALKDPNSGWMATSRCALYLEGHGRQVSGMEHCQSRLLKHVLHFPDDPHAQAIVGAPAPPSCAGMIDHVMLPLTACSCSLARFTRVCNRLESSSPWEARRMLSAGREL